MRKLHSLKNRLKRPLNWSDYPAVWKKKITKEEIDHFYLIGMMNEDTYDIEVEKLEKVNN